MTLLPLHDLVAASTPWVQQTTDVAIAYDLFPAEVILPAPANSLGRTKVTIVTHPTPTLYVFADTQRGSAAIIEAPIDPRLIYGNITTGLDVYAGLDPANPQTATVVQIRPMNGCGCGSRLKNFRPWSTMRHTAPPTPAGPLPAPPVAPPPAPAAPQGQAAAVPAAP